MNNLVIVESPTKARTLSKFLGSGYQIEASMGHIRDLPKSELGIDIEKDFEPQYIIPRDKRKRVNELKKLAKDAKVLWLATDPDREGEAIAWHIEHLLEHKEGEVHRVVFHEITPEAIKEAFANPRDLDLKLIDAQQARRVLDRIVGYKLSPLLWKKIKRGLSAGRVQSIALRLIVEREREIEAFKAVEYWSIEANVETDKKATFIAALIEKDKKKLEIKTEAEAKEHLANLEKAKYQIEKITEREVRRQSAPPFTTSTLQQAAGNKLHMSAKKTMMLAQNLYEHGLITYMRTDSLNIAPSALAAARDYIKSNFGDKYLPPSARFFKSKSKNAQEAHEAIRPTDMKTSADQVKDMEGFSKDHGRLYDLIWKRMISSQMNEAVFKQTSVDVSADSYTFRASGSVIEFDGWLKVYGVKELEEEDEEGKKKQVLPELTQGELLKLLGLDPQQHFTEPPPRYTEASLIKKLEELGIGRPSTYAPILSTIQDRYYVERIERKFKPSSLGLSVNDFLMKYFSDVFDYNFTAQMEDALDEISRGEREWKATIGTFYKPFEEKLVKTEGEAEKVQIEVEKVDRQCPKCGKDLIIRYGRFGKFLACSGFPDCKHTEAIEEKVNAKCPDDGGDIVVRKTKKGKVFYGCKNWPECKYASWTKPKGADSEPAVDNPSKS
jgi:DNA topoisomerase I